MTKIKSFIALMLVGVMFFTGRPVGLEWNISYAHGSENELDCNHDHEHEHNALINCESSSGIKIAVFDSGISEVEVSGSVSFIEDNEILSDHGNTIAQSLKALIPDAELYDVRILNNNNEGTYSNFSKAVQWAIDNDIDIISLSSVGFEASDILISALDEAEEHNILVIAAAGNEASDEPTFPASYPTVISVGALDADSQIAQYSNFGKYVDVYAYPSSEGTSYSTPYIIAKAVEIVKSNSDISVKNLRDQITGGKKKETIKSNNNEDGILYAAACSHTYSYTTSRAATCTTAGIKVGKCTKCKATTSVSIAALGHSYGSWSTTKSPTCTATGVKSRKCTRSGCYATQTQSIAATGHSFSGNYVITKGATCTVAGTKVGKCNKCAAVISTVSIPALGHSYGSWSTTKSPTCTVAGSQTRKCTRSGCSTTQTQSIAATGHSFSGSYNITKNATCTAEGTKVGKCNKCAAIITTVSIPALGHSYGSWSTTKSPTCSTTGVQTRKCTRSGCTATQTQSIPTTVHSFSGDYITVTGPTCTAAGTKVGKCKNCGTTLSNVAIPALGHSYGDWVVTKSPDCLTTGIQMRKCTRSGCTATQTQSIPTTVHSFNGDYITVEGPTCISDGTKVGKCRICGITLSTVAIPALGHSYGDWVITKEANCLSTGIKMRSCTRTGCFAKETQSIPTTVHSFNGDYITVEGPTCISDGTKIGKCRICGITLSTVVIPALGHSYGDWVVIKEANCNSIGVRTRSCTRIGCDEKETLAIPITVHSFNGEYIVVKEPTLINEGLKVGRCSNCNEILSTITIPSLGRNIGDFSILDNYVKRSEWEANPINEEKNPEYISGDLASYYDTIVIHHSERSGDEDIRDLQEYHQNSKGFSDIGYHYVINEDGIIYEGRPINTKGEHVFGNNSNKIGIVLLGNFNDGNPYEDLKNWVQGAEWTYPTDKQIESLKNLIDVLDSLYGIDQVGGHRDFYIEGHSTVCPGNKGYQVLLDEGIIDLAR